MLHHRLKEAQAAVEEDDDNRAGQKTAKAIEAIIRLNTIRKRMKKIDLQHDKFHVEEDWTS